MIALSFSERLLAVNRPFSEGLIVVAVVAGRLGCRSDGCAWVVRGVAYEGLSGTTVRLWGQSLAEGDFGGALLGDLGADLRGGTVGRIRVLEQR